MSATTGFTSKLKVAGNKIVPGIDGFNLAAANIEQSYALPIGTVYLAIQNMGKTILRLAYAATETADGGDYTSIHPGVLKELDNIGTLSLTVYLSAAAVQRVEIETWT